MINNNKYKIYNNKLKILRNKLNKLNKIINRKLNYYNQDPIMDSIWSLYQVIILL